MDCPKCGAEDLYRDQADVGVGIIYGPYGCHSCGWSEDPRYDRSSGTSEAQKELGDGWYVDSTGCARKVSVIADDLARFGIPKEHTESVFKNDAN